MNDQVEQSTCNYSFHQVAAGLVPLMSPPPTPNIFESDSEEEQDPVSDSDSDSKLMMLLRMKINRSSIILGPM